MKQHSSSKGLIERMFEPIVAKESMLRRGSTQPDGTYIYKCGCCFEIPSCSYCYGGDLAKCQEAIKVARGQVYYGLLKVILSHVGKQMVVEAKGWQGKLAVVDLGYFALKYKLNFKATCEWFEETHVLPIGTHERIMASLKVKAIFDAAREKYPELSD